jgi:predicted O-linked N-acetylglucosamine transferase (SPINDLY family)
LALAERIEAEGIDLLVDLNGYSAMERLPLIALHPAPVVAGWFNLYATTGVSGYDYLIGDERVIPREEEKYYCEKIVRMPGSYLTFEVTYPVPPVADPPCLAGGGVTFGSLAPLYKITEQAVAAWSRILQRVPGSSLMIRNRELGSKGARGFLHSLFERHGVSSIRLRLEGPAEHYQFLETYGAIDIALDTFPYNGGTTTTEAIWQGAPVVAFSGDRWVSRTSASILHAAGLGELVGGSLEDYVEISVRLAQSPERLLDLRRNARTRLAASSVCDTETFARNMEQIYTELAG